ncbi:winged helix-turn-helix domain-containing protein [Serratia sp. L9]|uniref:winged helix-turn-helix domain-containing protein n=1 Tax=Serratia sp. L9 TaxID=3423946 RepID=UPI003D67124A
MHYQYVINDSIVFYPDNNLLMQVNDSTKTLTLHESSARCLQLLLENDHDTVSQRDFYPYVWGDAKEVAPNTLYQSIHVLRKSLTIISPDSKRDIIITVPKIGFKINDEVKISYTIEKSPRVKTKPASECLKVASKTLLIVTGKYKAMMIIFALVLLISNVLLINYETNRSHTKLFNSYIISFKKQSCTIYSHQEASTLAPALVNQSTGKVIDCAGHPVIYIANFSSIAAATSIISCSRHDEASALPTCISVFSSDIIPTQNSF